MSDLSPIALPANRPLTDPLPFGRALQIPYCCFDPASGSPQRYPVQPRIEFHFPARSVRPSPGRVRPPQAKLAAKSNFEVTS